jgi:hypothetical protein
VELLVDERGQQQVVVLQAAGAQGEDRMAVGDHLGRAVDHDLAGEDPAPEVVLLEQAQELVPGPDLVRAPRLQLDLERGRLNRRRGRRAGQG